jgi:hypothetical protein
MRKSVSLGVRAVCALVVLILCSPSSATTIIKLSLGETGPDVGMSVAGGTFSTSNDGVGVTTGDQNSAIEYTSFLDGIPDIPTNIASFTVAGVTAAGAPTPLGGGVLLQNFVGGSFSLFDPANTLLLGGNFSTLVLSGGASGSLFTISNATVTGGTLAPLIVPNSVSMSFAFTNINGGAGLSVSQGNTLNPFVADAVVTIAANPTPEPASLSTIALAALALMKRRRLGE